MRRPGERRRGVGRGRDQRRASRPGRARRGVHSDRRRRTTDEPEAGGVGDDPRVGGVVDVTFVNVLFLRYAMFVGLGG